MIVSQNVDMEMRIEMPPSDSDSSENDDDFTLVEPMKPKKVLQICK